MLYRLLGDNVDRAIGSLSRAMTRLERISARHDKAASAKRRLADNLLAHADESEREAARALTIRHNIANLLEAN